MSLQIHPNQLLLTTIEKNKEIPDIILYPYAAKLLSIN